MDDYFNHKDINYTLFKKNFNKILKNKKNSNNLRGGQIFNNNEFIDVLLNFDINFNIRINDKDLFNTIKTIFALSSNSKQSYNEVTMNNIKNIDLIIKFIKNLDNSLYEITKEDNTRIDKGKFINFIIKQEGLLSKNFKKKIKEKKKKDFLEKNKLYRMVKFKYNNLIILNNYILYGLYLYSYFLNKNKNNPKIHLAFAADAAAAPAAAAAAAAAAPAAAAAAAAAAAPAAPPPPPAPLPLSPGINLVTNAIKNFKNIESIVKKISINNNLDIKTHLFDYSKKTSFLFLLSPEKSPKGFNQFVKMCYDNFFIKLKIKNNENYDTIITTLGNLLDNDNFLKNYKFFLSKIKIFDNYIKENKNNNNSISNNYIFNLQ